MMTYRNKKTGAVIETNGHVSGENWERVAPASPVADPELKPEDSEEELEEPEDSEEEVPKAPGKKKAGK